MEILMMVKKRSKLLVWCERVPKGHIRENGKVIGYRGTKCYIKSVGRARKCKSPITGYAVKCVDVVELTKAPYGVPK